VLRFQLAEDAASGMMQEIVISGHVTDANVLNKKRKPAFLSRLSSIIL
jgi:hypothetical protein